MSFDLLKIVVSGGPKSGLSEFFELVRKRHIDLPIGSTFSYVIQGWPTIFVPSSREECLAAGFGPDNPDRISFEEMVLETLLHKENLMKKYAEDAYRSQDRALLIFHGGLNEAAAHLTPGEYSNLIDEMELTDRELDHLRYDHVLFMHSTAAEMPERFLNPADAKKARQLSDRVLHSWGTHSSVVEFPSRKRRLDKYEQVYNGLLGIVAQA